MKTFKSFITEEVFYWYLIKGNFEKGKVAFVGTERQVKIKRHDPKFSGDYVMAKSRKDLKMGDAWKRSMGVSEEFVSEEMLEATKDIKKYTVADFKKFGRAGRGFKTTAFVKFLYMDDSDAGREAGSIKGTDNRILKQQQPTALYMTVNGPEPGGFLYPAGSYYVGHGRVNAVGEVVMAWTGTARLVTYNLKEAISYIKKFGNVSLQKKQIEKGTKGWDAWPTTYDTTGDFEGQGAGSKINRITNINSIKYK